jgi:hypothetical protein
VFHDHVIPSLSLMGVVRSPWLFNKEKAFVVVVIEVFGVGRTWVTTRLKKLEPINISKICKQQQRARRRRRRHVNPRSGSR